MRILVIATNYAPETTTAAFVTAVCEHFAAQGNEVVVLTAFPFYPEWRVREEYRGAIYRTELLNGVQVRRVKHFIPRRPSSLVQRLLHDFSFAFNAFVAGLFTGPCDLIYCSCQPAAVAYVAYGLSKVKRAPYVVKLTDVASDLALSTGFMREGPLAELARRIERFGYRHAHAIVCLCQGFVEKMKAWGIEEERLHIISDWGHTVDLPLRSPASFRRANGIDEEFVVLHSGNMGKKQGLMNVIESAELSRADSSLLWVLAGEGEERKHIEQEIQRRGLSNVRLLPMQPAENLGEMYAAADLLLLNQRAAVQDAVIPSKLLTYMGAGRPVVAAVNERSEAARQIAAARCGVVVAPEQPAALLEAVRALRANRALREQFGVSGRGYAQQNFSKSKVLREYDALFESLVPAPLRSARAAAGS